MNIHVYICKVESESKDLVYSASRNPRMDPQVHFRISEQEQDFLLTPEDIAMFVKTKAFQLLVQTDGGGKFIDTVFVMEHQACP